MRHQGGSQLRRSRTIGEVEMCEQCGDSLDPTLAERYGATDRDRRLEAAICNGLHHPLSAETAPGRDEDAGIGMTERELTERGRRIAGFLINEYLAKSHLQREFFVHLAAEIVQRVDEDMPRAGKIRIGCAPLKRPEAKAIRRFAISLGLLSRFFRRRIHARK
jgi:hypothetical protein